MYRREISSHTHVKDPVVHVRVRWTMERSNMTQHALKVSKVFQNVEGGHCTEEEEEEEEEEVEDCQCARFC